LHGQANETQGTRYSPLRIRATWDGTGSVEDASRALRFSRAKGYDLVRRGEFPCRVLESGEPEHNGALAGH
jgi:hypothetical protein